MYCRVVVVVIVGGIPVTANTNCEEINCDAAPCPRDALLLTRHGHTATHCNTLQHTATHCNTLPLHAYLWIRHGREGASAHSSRNRSGTWAATPIHTLRTSEVENVEQTDIQTDRQNDVRTLRDQGINNQKGRQIDQDRSSMIWVDLVVIRRGIIQHRINNHSYSFKDSTYFNEIHTLMIVFKWTSGNYAGMLCRLRMCFYVTVTLKDIYMSNNFDLISLRRLFFFIRHIYVV